MCVLLKRGLIISHSAASSSLASWFLWPEHDNYISAIYVMNIHIFLQSFKTAFFFFISSDRHAPPLSQWYAIAYIGCCK